MALKGSTIFPMLFLLLLQLQDSLDYFMVLASLPYIRKDFNLTEKQTEVLNIVYIICFGVIVPLFGAICDCCDKKGLIYFGVLAQIIVTVGSTVIPIENYSFYLLLLARILSSFAHASYSTIPTSIISDLFEGSRLIWMLSLYQIATITGNGLAYIISSEFTTTVGPGWRWGLWFASGFSLITMLVVELFMKVPKRVEADGTNSEHRTRTVKTCLCSFVQLWSNPSLITSILGLSAQQFIQETLNLWIPKYFAEAREQLYPNQKCQLPLCLNDSILFGILTIVAAIAGVPVGVRSSLWYRKRKPRADPIICAIGLLCTSPLLFLCIIFAEKSLVASYILCFLALMLLHMAAILTASIILSVVTPEKRCCAVAIAQLMPLLLGTLPGSFLIGEVKVQLCKASPTALEYQCIKYSVMLCGFVSIVGGVFYIFTSMGIVKDRKETENPL